MNTKTASPVLRRPPSRFERMQQAELAWWVNFAAGESSRERMYALYGIRYGDWFWNDLYNPGDVVEFGSGPMPVMRMCHHARTILACDTLYEVYRNAGIADDLPYVTRTEDVPDESFDTALVLNVLDHTDRPEIIVDEAHRSLRQGGKALFYFHLGQQDSKHMALNLVKTLEHIGTRFKIVRECRRLATVYDPEALYAVGVK